MPEGQDWDRLGAALVERRIQIDPRYKNRRLFAREVGLNWRLLFDIEQHKRSNFEPETLMAIARAYRVTYESLLDTLHGGFLQPSRSDYGERDGREPEAGADAAPEPSVTAAVMSASVAAIDALLQPTIKEVRAEVDVAKRRAKMRGPDAYPAGREVFSDLIEAEAWDFSRNPQDEDARISFIAWVRMKRREAQANPGRPSNAR